MARARRSGRDPSSTGAPEIAPGVFCLGPTGRTQTNVYLVHAGSAWFVVDTGWAGDAERIAAAGRDLAGPNTSPAAILLTHVHPDHAGAARPLAEAWGCPILTHPADLPIADGDFAEMERVAGPLDRWAILPVMRAIGPRRRGEALARSSLTGLARGLPSGGEVPGMEGWVWIHTPGHTPGHVSYVRPSDRVVLSGDALLTLRVNALAGLVAGAQGLSGPPWYTTWDARRASASVRAIAELEPAVLGPGHGQPLLGPRTAGDVQAFAERQA